MPSPLSTAVRAAFVIVMALALTGCLLSPGKFTSELKLMKDGTFAYSYVGEIQMLALSKLAQMGAMADDKFSADPCFEDDTFDARECTPAELEAQKQAWEDGAEDRRAKKDRELEQMRTMFGGIDPSSAEAAEELAKRLSRQKGWNRVTHRGDGLFDVDFAISGDLTHDFLFPTIERLPMGNAFVTMVLRKDGQVRVDAPGFAAQTAGNPMSGMMPGLMGMAAIEDSGSDGPMPKIVTPEGRFTLITDGTILANNTDEGPTSTQSAQLLEWNINQRTDRAPTALIQIAG